MMPPPLVLWAVAIAAAALGLRACRVPTAETVQGGAARPPAVIARAARIPWPPGALGPLARPGDATAIVRAGLGDAITVEALARARASLAVAGLVAGALLAVATPAAAPLLPVLALAGAWAPGRWLAGRVRARGRALLRELPDLLDLLAICVESGMALDPALAVTGRRLGGALGEEVGRVLRDLSLGTPRAAAYRALVDRAGVTELARTVGALLQAEELGAPLSRALHGQAESLRAARRQAARDRAARAAPKIQLVVAMVMVPAILLLVIGVLAIEMARQVGAVIS
ncbi:MAG TPA: type II secretion system F family protein [Miltoncostaea sp.]|nr:type II secretion system F family protein [Miltoncostaea sp.]